MTCLSDGSTLHPVARLVAGRARRRRLEKGGQPLGPQPVPAGRVRDEVAGHDQDVLAVGSVTASLEPLARGPQPVRDARPRPGRRGRSRSASQASRTPIEVADPRGDRVGVRRRRCRLPIATSPRASRVMSRQPVAARAAAIGQSARGSPASPGDGLDERGGQRPAAGGSIAGDRLVVRGRGHPARAGARRPAASPSTRSTAASSASGRRPTVGPTNRSGVDARIAAGLATGHRVTADEPQAERVGPQRRSPPSCSRRR